jgi:hypothetical protein
MGWRGCVDHASITLDKPGHSLRRWLPLQILQGYLGLTGCLGDLDIINIPARITVTGCFPTCLIVVGGLDPCLFSSSYSFFSSSSYSSGY